MKTPQWHRYFLDLLPGIAARSKDESTQVGCIIVGPDHEIRSTGYNSFPRGINDNDPERQKRPAKYLFFEHAERNAIYNAAKVGTPLKGCTLYVNFYPCDACARAIIQSGIQEVVIEGKGFASRLIYWNDRWKEEIGAALVMFDEAGIKMTIFEKDPESSLT